MASVLQQFSDQRSPLNLQRRAHILWEEGQPKTVLIVKKADNEDCSNCLKTMAKWSALITLSFDTSLSLFLLFFCITRASPEYGKHFHHRPVRICNHVVVVNMAETPCLLVVFFQAHGQGNDYSGGEVCS